MGTLTGGEGVEAVLKDLARKVSTGGTLRVGFLENATYPDGTPVAMVAATQNYGAPSRGVPPRPFFSKMIADNLGGWARSLKAVFRAANYDGRKALQLFGQGVAGQLREAIVDMADPPLSPVTLLLHDRFPSGGGYTFADVLQARHDIANGVTPSGAHANPLIWSGHMLNSVDTEIVA